LLRAFHRLADWAAAFRVVGEDPMHSVTQYDLKRAVGLLLNAGDLRLPISREICLEGLVLTHR
jgi:hypothetical protein